MLIERAVARHGLDDPYPVQYVRWLGNLVRGNRFCSPTLGSGALPGLLARDIGAAGVSGAAFAFVGMPGDLFAYWWVFVPVTLALALFSTAWNLAGDGLAAALEPSPA